MIRLILCCALLTACSTDGTEPLPDVAPVTHPLVDNFGWTEVAPGPDDPWYADNQEVANRCDVDKVKVEELPEGPWYELVTTKCAYHTARIPLPMDVPAGAEILLRIWHFKMLVAEGPFTVVVAVGEPPEVIHKEVINAPNTESGLIHPTFKAVRAWKKGEPIWWHLRNHGDNTWGFIELSATF